MAKIELEYAYSLSKEQMIIYKNKKELCTLNDIYSIELAKRIFKSFISEVDCWLDAFSDGESNNDKFEWIVGYAKDDFEEQENG